MRVTLRKTVILLDHETGLEPATVQLGKIAYERRRAAMRAGPCACLSAGGRPLAGLSAGDHAAVGEKARVKRELHFEGFWRGGTKLGCAVGEKLVGPNRGFWRRVCLDGWSGRRDIRCFFAVKGVHESARRGFEGAKRCFFVSFCALRGAGEWRFDLPRCTFGIVKLAWSGRQRPYEHTMLRSAGAAGPSTVSGNSGHALAHKINPIAVIW